MKKLALSLIALSGLFFLPVKAQPIVTESTSVAKTKVESPPPSAISPSITTINEERCNCGGRLE